jgi:hypothetical protein
VAYPSTLDELTDGVPSDGAAPTTSLGDVTFPHDDHHRALGTAVEAIETVLGTNPLSRTVIDAKGDLIAGTAADTAAAVTAGADRTLLRADSNATPGVRWGLDAIRTRSTYWHLNSHLNTPAGTAWPILSRAYYVPFFLPGRNVITAVGVNVTAAGNAGNVVRLGIYSDTSFAPGALLDQGTVAGDGIAFCTWTPSSPVAVTDLFWLAAAPQGSAAPGSTWLSLLNPWGLAQQTAQESGAAWAGTYTSGISRYSAEAGAFSSTPALTLEVTSRNPYLAVRLQ